jgi:HEAT repeat protein
LTQTLLQDEDEQVRGTAAWALGEIGDTAAVPSLMEALQNDQNQALVNEIVKALQKIGPAAVAALVQLLQHDNAQVSLPVAHALAQLGGAAVDSLVEAMGSADARVADYASVALEQIGTTAAEALVQRLEHAEGPQRRQVLELLGQVGGPPALPPLLQALASEEAETRGAAARSLGRLGDARAVGPLIQTWDDPEPTVAHAAALALGQLADTTALGVLFRDLTAVAEVARLRGSEEAAPSRSEQAAQALRQVNIHGPAQSSLRVLENPAVYVNQELQRGRTLAITLRQLPTFHQIMFPEERQQLTAYLESSQLDLNLPELTRSLLQRLGFERRADRGVTVDGVDLRLLDAPWQVLRSMEWGADLGELYLWAGQALFRRNHPRFLEIFLHALQHGSESVRLEAIETLGSTGHPGAVEPLLELLTEPDPRIQEAAAAALESLGTPRHSMALQSYRDARAQAAAAPAEVP